MNDISAPTQRLTSPVAAMAVPVSLDTFRKRFADDPVLRGLAVRIGQAWTFDPADLPTIRTRFVKA